MTTRSDRIYGQTSIITILPLLFIVFIFSNCQPEEQPPVERPRDPWVIRSVLDQQIRMVTLAMHEEAYAAYNTETCALYKVWKGGVYWDGAAFNNLKTVQPESYGVAYLEKPKLGKPWKMEVNGQQKPVSPRFHAYHLKNNSITLEYTLAVNEGESIRIFEQPEFFFNDKGQPVFERKFTTENMPNSLKLWNGEYPMPSNTSQTFAETFKPIPPLPEEMLARNVSAAGSQYKLDRSGCNTCHEMDERTIGPSYHEIANRYERNDTNTQMLTAKVRDGGTGAWGDVPMSPHPHLKEGDVRKLVRFILSLKPKEGKPSPKKTASEPDPDDPERKTLQVVEQTLPKPGFGRSLEGLHPSLALENIRPAGFEPRVGGMDFLPDGRLLVSTWDSIGAVYALSGVETGDTSRINVQRIASGLSEPLGLKVVDGNVFVLQKHELTQLIDHDGDGLTDEYRNLCNTFQATPDFHEFSYGLEYKDGFFYANLGLAMRLMGHETQLPDRGTTIKIAPDGSYTKLVTGLRQANGLGFGPDNELFITENQGQWVPSCKVIHVQAGDFHGCQHKTGDRYEGQAMVPPAVWLPQDEIGNSPGQPILVDEGPYRGQMLHGEVTHGGLKRVFLEKVNGTYQGSVFRFTQGLEAGINRVAWGPEGALYVGGVGMNGNWGWNGTTFGLQKLAFTDQSAFEILKIEAQPNGFTLTFTEPLAEGQGETPDDYNIQQWRYEPTPSYGGPKLDLETLPVSRISVSDDRKSVQLEIPNLKERHVVYFLLNENLTGKGGKALWSGEAWYTLNQVPAS